MRKFITSFFALAFSVSSAYAGGTLTLMGIGHAEYGPKPAVITYRGSIACNSLASSCTLSSVAIGAPSANRIVVIGFGYTGRTVSSVTIAGISATAVNSQSGGAVYQAVVPSGTSASITVAFSGTTFSGISAYTIENLQSTTRTDTKSSTSTANSVSLSANTVKGGVVMAFNFSNAGSGGGFSTVNNDASFAVSSATLAVGSLGNTPAGTVSATRTYSGSASSSAFILSSWR